MSFQPGAMVYTQSFGSRPENVEVPHIDVRNPATTDVVGYVVGKRWVNTVLGSEYVLTSFSSSQGIITANWTVLGGASSDVNTLSGDTGTAVPTAGNIQIAGGAGVTTSASGSVVTVSLDGGGEAIDSFVPDAGTNPVVPAVDGSVTMSGTANQVRTTGGTNSLAFSLIGPYTPATYTAHGVLIGEGTSSIVATAAGTDGQVLTGNTGADPSFSAIGTKSGLTAHGVVLAEGAGAFAATSAGTSGQVFTSAGASVDGSYQNLGVNSGLTAHGVLLGEGNSAIAASGTGTSGQVFTSGGASADGAYQNIGVNSGLTAHGVLIAEGTSAFAATSAGTAGQIFVSGGASADPTWTTATFPTTAGSAGTILRSNGTGWVASTDTYPDTVAAGDLLLATSANIIGSLADVAVGQLLASGGVGVAPAYTASPSVSGSITAATGITATTGNIAASSGNVSASGTVTGGTGVTATTGNVTATNGNLVASTATTGLSLNVVTASGAASGTVNCNGRVGSVTFTGVSIAAAADLTLTMGNTSIAGASTRLLFTMSGSTTGSAPSVKSVTPSANQIVWVVTNGTGATTTTANITFDFIVMN